MDKLNQEYRKHTRRSLNLELAAVGRPATKKERRSIMARRDKAWKAYRDTCTHQKKFEEAVKFSDFYFEIIRDYREAKNIWKEHFEAISIKYRWT